jgi:hypothetical protein
MTTEYDEIIDMQQLTMPFCIQSRSSLSGDPSFEKYISAAQAMINQMIPEHYWVKLRSSPSEETLRSIFFHFSRYVPILDYATFADGAGGVVIKTIYPSEFTQGAGRYISDLFSLWLVPGKLLESQGIISIDFKFKYDRQKRYYFQQEFFRLTHPSDLSVALDNIARLLEETRLNILAVFHARAISATNNLSSEQRSQTIQETIFSLFSPNPKSGRNVYDQMHQFMLKLSEEEKITQVKKNISRLINSHPQNFDRDIYYEMNAFSSNFSTYFAMIRDPGHISRVIAYHYLFKKRLLAAIQYLPQERRVIFKLLKGPLKNQSPCLGILIGINLLKETERFDKKHLMGAIQNCLPQSIAVADSFIVDRREEKLRLFYIEIQKAQQTQFTLQEIRLLQQDLPTLIKRQVENVVHPIFMPRNEEEVLRNIILLSKQIKFLRDLPHLTIHYEKQTDSEISFLIVMVRLLKDNELPFKELVKDLESDLRIAIDEIRSAGTLKRRYPKEAVIFRIILDKSTFFRKDYSLDLKRARQKVSSSLRRILGEFRDYNGGMIHKQNEALELLRKTIGPSASKHEILLENYFYSLRPGIMQTVQSAEVLKILFYQLLEALNEDLSVRGFGMKTSENNKHFFATVVAAAPTFKEDALSAIARLKIASYDLTTTFLHVHETAAIGFIYRTDETEKRLLFQQTLLDVMLKWKVNFSCQIR